jgi:hypothetical protein
MRLAKMRVAAVNRKQTDAPIATPELSPYQTMDADERSILKMFIDRGVADLAGYRAESD